MTLVAIIGILALTLTVVGFFRNDLVLWIVDTLLWFVWAYAVVNWIISSPVPGNSYMPEAVGLLGASFVLLCIYKDFSLIIASIRSRRPSPGPTYDEDVAQLREGIRRRTRSGR
jgi:hypothetical protein